jgi:predicted ABC-type transport system involved in lysophospholipase L1 biosynthesis ATPase subunit
LAVGAALSLPDGATAAAAGSFGSGGSTFMMLTAGIEAAEGKS